MFCPSNSYKWYNKVNERLEKNTEEFHMENFTKEEQIKKLDNVTLVLGNGFDLHNKLKTSYSNFFEAVKREQYKRIQKTFCIENDYSFNRFLDDSAYYMAWTLLDPFVNYNVWDIIFALSSQSITPSKEILWADIEKEILSWLKDEIPEIKIRVISYCRNTISNEIKSLRIHSIAAFIKRKRESNPLTTSDDFYRYLLNELLKFETEFGDYIQKETDRGVMN